MTFQEEKIFLLISYYIAIRLVNEDSQNIKKSAHYGIVEIYRDKKWWRLSDSHWSEADANVVCHYLGYDRASEIYTGSLPKMNGTVLSVDFSCHGNEGDLAECIQKEEKTNSRNNAKSSGVRCTVDGKHSKRSDSDLNKTNFC